MGQVYTRESQPFQMNEQRLYKLKKQSKRAAKQVDNASQQSENLYVKNITNEMKVKVVKSKRADSETEDESTEEQNSGSQQSVSSEETNSYDQNNDQHIDDISPRNKQVSNVSAKKSTTSRKQQKPMKKTNMFVGSLGYATYLEYSQQNYKSYDEKEIKQQIRRQYKEQQQNKQQQSVLSEISE